MRVKLKLNTNWVEIAYNEERVFNFREENERKRMLIIKNLNIYKSVDFDDCISEEKKERKSGDVQKKNQPKDTTRDIE